MNQVKPRHRPLSGGGIEPNQRRRPRGIKEIVR
jgi:hypothetical protein